jgi:hypothetical protein
VTLSVAWTLVVVPRLLLTTTSNFAPLSAAVVQKKKGRISGPQAVRSCSDHIRIMF